MAADVGSAVPALPGAVAAAAAAAPVAAAQAGRRRLPQPPASSGSAAVGRALGPAVCLASALGACRRLAAPGPAARGRVAQRARQGRKPWRRGAAGRPGAEQPARLGKKQRRQLERQQAEEDEEAAEGPRGPLATGRVVGGAERHGQVLVELLPGEGPGPGRGEGAEGEGPTVCGVPRGRGGPSVAPIVGDLVSVEFDEEGGELSEPMVRDVLPRRTTLLRRSHGSRHKPQLLCANLDLAVLVVSVEPNFSELMVDRVLVSAHAQGLDAAIVLNKFDILSPDTSELDEVQARLEPYERIGYPVFRTSALTGEGVLELRKLLSGKTSILIGNSGVGKSHLLNCLSAGQIQAQVGEISSKLRLGKHTTTTSTLHRLPPREDGEEDDDALLIDSPGARRFAIWDVEAEDLKDHFVEFLPLAGHCRFRNCDHLNSVDCAVKDAVQMGRIPLERYKRYARIRECLLSGQEGDIDGIHGRLTTWSSDVTLPAEIREYEPLREYKGST